MILILLIYDIAVGPVSFNLYFRTVVQLKERQTLQSLNPHKFLLRLTPAELMRMLLQLAENNNCFVPVSKSYFISFWFT